MRPRLNIRLEQGLARKLTVISAPAGYGKTTLLGAWLAVCEQPAAWVSLDKRDNDPARFWTYVVDSFRRLFSSFGEAFPDTLANFNLRLDDVLITELINELDALQQPVVLVLDDYHNIESQAIHEGLSFLLDHAPAHFHLILATRADPPLPLARLRARSQMVEIRLADLRFTTAEISEFLHQAMGLELSAEDLALLETSTEGWAAGLQMAGLSLQGQQDISGFIRTFNGEDRYILDFLFDEVFQKQTEAVQNFLLRTSILNQFCDPLCNAVTLQGNSQKFLDNLERNNLFLISLDEQRKWYRYHYLFKDLLKSRLSKMYPEEIPVLHQRASTWYAAEGDYENAINHSLAARDFEQAAYLIGQTAQVLDRHNKQALLAHWLDSLPREILETRPWLCVYRAWGSYWMGNRAEVESWLQIAEKYLDMDFNACVPEKRHIQGHIAAIRAFIALTAEDIPVVLEMGQRSLDLLPETDEMRCESAIALGGAYWALGDTAKSEQAFREAQHAALQISNTLAVPATGYVGLQQLKQGRLQDAMITYQEGLRLATLPGGRETPVACISNARMGDVCRERNEFNTAYQLISRGVEQSIQLGQPDVLIEAYVCLARYQLAVGDLEAVHETLDQAVRVAQQTRVDPFTLTWLDECRLKAWLRAGNLEAALTWVRASELQLDEPFNYLHDLPHVNLARVLVGQAARDGSGSTYSSAAVLLVRLRDAAEKAGWVHEQIKILVLLAINHQAHGAPEAAVQNLARAVCLAEPGGYVRVFLDEGEIVRGLLARIQHILRKGRGTIRLQLGIELQEEVHLRIRTYILKLLAADEKPALFQQPSKSAGSAQSSQRKPGLVHHPDADEIIIEMLSTREMEVIKLLEKGFSEKKIASNLVISYETVHKHLKNIYEKLGVHSRMEAVARAREMNLL